MSKKNVLSVSRDRLDSLLKPFFVAATLNGLFWGLMVAIIMSYNGGTTFDAMVIGSISLTLGLVIMFLTNKHYGKFEWNVREKYR